MMAKKKGDASEPLSRENLLIDPRFETLEDKNLSETLDILASIICNYMERKDKNDQTNSS